MKGCRALTGEEVGSVLNAIQGNRYPLRDKALFLLGLRSGFRISELLSLRVSDVLQNGHYVDRVSVARRNMKKKKEGRTVALHPEAKEALKVWVDRLKETHQEPETFVFRSQEGKNRAIGRSMAWTMLTKAYEKCGLTGKLGTHCMRKTFAKRVYEKLGRDLLKTQKAMGHARVDSTVSYLSVDGEEIDDAILKS